MHGNIKRCGESQRRGFTLVEVLIVLVIIGIAAGIVVPHMLETGTLRAQAAARAIIADILFAQNEAIAMQSPRRVAFNVDDDQYSLTDGGGTALPAPSRSGGLYTVDFGNDRRFEGVALSAADFDGEAVLEFDALGSPSSGGQVEVTAGDTRYRITVAAFTGRVTIELVVVSGG